MSTLKTHNLQSPDSGSANIALTPNAGMIVTGFTTFTDHVKIDDGPVIEKSTNSALQITTPTGYVSVGPQNSSYSHFYTDRGRYYFNRKIVVDEGVISSYDEDLILATNAGNDGHVIIKTDGKTGIGTALPTTQLQIVGSTSSAGSSGGTLGIRQKGDTGNDGIVLTSSHANSARIFKDNNGTFRIFNTGGSDNQFCITNTTGSVGIGTVNPNTRLHIHHPTTNGLALFESSDAYCHIIFQDSNSNTTTLPHFGVQGDDFRFVSHNGTEGIEQLRIKSDGNIGINTNTPTEQLVIYKGVGGNPSGNATFRMRSDTSSTHMTLDARGTNASNMIYFTSGTQAYDAFLQLKHNNSGDHYLRYCHNSSAAETFRIHSTGALGLGGANYGTAGQVLKSNGSSAEPSWSGGAQRVLEVVASPCDGSTISTSNGDVTFQNVTGVQNLSTTFTDVTGSKITYTPPTGTTQVIYEFNFQMSRLDALAISHYRMYIAGNEVTYARSELAAEDGCIRTTIRWIFNIGGSTNNATGRQSSWTSGKEIKLQAEDYGGSYDVQLHETNWWNGSGDDQFSMPTLSLTAIGV